MLRVSGIGEARAVIREARSGGARIGFVPTMGALHEGHLSLVERARKTSDFVVLSIFVNPLQFGPAEDFSRYPRPIEQDERMAAGSGIDLLFTPGADAMYPAGHIVRVDAGAHATKWEGAVRPGHFAGVLTVVAKLFNIVQPDVAVFGQKDLQQAALIRAMVRDLDFAIRIDIAPTVREADGLALSSRNAYLAEDERAPALALYSALRAVVAAYRAGERSTSLLEGIGRSVLAEQPTVRPDYFAVVSSLSFDQAPLADDGSAAITAARIGRTRLIDNMLLGADDQG